MKTTLRPLLPLIATLLTAPGAAMAAITAADVAPTTRAVAPERTASATLTWRATRTVNATTGAGAGETIRSPEGRFLDAAGNVLERVNRLLTITRPLPSRASAPETLTLQETVRIPAALLYRAHKAGLDRFYYERTFDDGSGAASARVELRLTSAAAAAFDLSRLALTFDGGWLFRVVAHGEPLRPRATLTFSGSGQLRATWEVAEPASTATGGPRFRPLKSLRRYLTGGGEVVITGPPLPTGVTGTYLVRLRIDAPQSDFTPPVLYYQVGAATAPPRPIEAHAPMPGALFDPARPFQWQAVEGARAYQIEIRTGAATDRPPLTGVVITGPPGATLPATTRAHLAPGRYFWRVVALDREGRVIAASTPRELRVATP